MTQEDSRTDKRAEIPPDPKQLKAFPSLLYYDLLNDMIISFPSRSKRGILTIFISTTLLVSSLCIYLILLLPVYRAQIILLSVLEWLVFVVVLLSIQRVVAARGQVQKGKHSVEYGYNLLKDKESEYQLDLETIKMVDEMASADAKIVEQESVLAKRPLAVLLGTILGLQVMQTLIANSIVEIGRQIIALLGLMPILAAIALLITLMLDAYGEDLEHRNANFIIRQILLIWKAEKAFQERTFQSQGNPILTNEELSDDKEGDKDIPIRSNHRIKMKVLSTDL